MYTPQFNKPTVLSVSQLTNYIKSVIENDPRLNIVFLSGEISNLTDHYSSGHIYLSLKDDKSVIRAVMFANNARRLVFRPQNGMKVICRGRVSVYPPSGQYQIYIEDMQPEGVGALALAFEQLKKELAQKGLFDRSKKKKLPRFPKTVGVVTSPTGAAVQDIRNVLTRRYPNVNIILCPVLVQGEGAAPQIIDAINKLDRYSLCDVIIVGRGGGSMEDLWAFNSEALAYAIYNCKIPVISAVGHETDFTICDYVSDLRAPTPSAAAELAVPDVKEVKATLRSQAQYLISLSERLIERRLNLLDQYKTRMYDAVVTNRIDKCLVKTENLAQRAKNRTAEIYREHESIYTEAASKLDGLNPYKVLLRGYSIVEKDGKIISSQSDLKQGDTIRVTMSDGSISAIVSGE